MTNSSAIKGRYYSTRINGKTTLVHRFVAEIFIPNVDNKPQVNHINNIGTDNRVQNLEWVTSSENVQHRYNLGGHKNQKITAKTIKFIKKKNSEGFKNQEIAEMLGCSRATIRAITCNMTPKVLKGSEQGRSILNEIKVLWIRNQYKSGKYTYNRIANLFGVTKQTIAAIVKRQSWTHI
jgi:transcriptional regulator